MADISKITLPNNDSYDIKDVTARTKANIFVQGTQTAPTTSGAWTGTCN